MNETVSWRLGYSKAKSSLKKHGSLKTISYLLVFFWVGFKKVPKVRFLGVDGRVWNKDAMIWSSEGGIDFVDCVNSVFFKYCWGVHVQAWWKLFDLDRLSKYLWRANICLIIFEIKNDRGSWILVILKNPSFCGFVAATAQFSEGSFSRLQISSGGLCPGDLNCYHRDSKKVMGAPIHAPTSPNVVHPRARVPKCFQEQKEGKSRKKAGSCAVDSIVARYLS